MGLPPYTRRPSRGRSRSIRLTVRHDGSVCVTAPRPISDAAVDAFVSQNADWIRDRIERARIRRASQVTIGTGTRTEYKEWKERARAFVIERLEHFNGVYGYRYTRISIKNHTTRWGSCSAKGNLNFNYRIALLPAHLADYIVVHELCHLGAMDHSRRFWDLVAKACPEYQKARAELRKIGMEVA